MLGWVRYALMVGILLMGSLLVWLVRGPAPVAPPLDVSEIDAEPPVDSPPLLRTVELNFDEQGIPRGPGVTYLEMMDLPSYVSRPSLAEWKPYADAEPVILADAERLWQSGLLESLWVDVLEESYANGVEGRHVVFHFIERDGGAVVPTNPPRVREAYDILPLGTSRLYPR